MNKEEFELICRECSNESKIHGHIIGDFIGVVVPPDVIVNYANTLLKDGQEITCNIISEFIVMIKTFKSYLIYLFSLAENMIDTYFETLEDDIDFFRKTPKEIIDHKEVWSKILSKNGYENWKGSLIRMLVKKESKKIKHKSRIDVKNLINNYKYSVLDILRRSSFYEKIIFIGRMKDNLIEELVRSEDNKEPKAWEVIASLQVIRLFRNEITHNIDLLPVGIYLDLVEKSIHNGFSPSDLIYKRDDEKIDYLFKKCEYVLGRIGYIDIRWSLSRQIDRALDDQIKDNNISNELDVEWFYIPQKV